ncbi:cupin domain-containing protein [Rhodococcus sp. NPDC003318]|uniref:cupin domain-containing protein n=1 Tax=Rhodococcus sp. NPDC003318 TaxID=3364503 RepID=UPI00368C8594
MRTPLTRLAATGVLAGTATMGLVVAVTAALAAPASATPSQGVTADDLAELELAPSLLPPPPAGHPPLPDETEGSLRRLVIAPGGSTGWHHHNGHVQGIVVSGTLTRVLADCSRVVSGPGSWVSEDPGSDHVGLNLGSDPVVLLVTYLLPDDEPFAEDAPARCS